MKNERLELAYRSGPRTSPCERGRGKALALLLNVRTLIFPSLDAQARMAPSSWGAQEIEFTIRFYVRTALYLMRGEDDVAKKIH